MRQHPIISDSHESNALSLHKTQGRHKADKRQTTHSSYVLPWRVMDLGVSCMFVMWLLRWEQIFVFCLDELATPVMTYTSSDSRQPWTEDQTVKWWHLVGVFQPLYPVLNCWWLTAKGAWEKAAVVWTENANCPLLSFSCYMSWHDDISNISNSKKQKARFTFSGCTVSAIIRMQGPFHTLLVSNSLGTRWICQLMFSCRK